MTNPQPYQPHIPIIEDIQEKYDGSIIMMPYGKAGVGKTEFGGSVGPDGLIVMVGSGEMTLSSPGFLSRYPKERRPKITYIRGDPIDPVTGFFKRAESFDKLRDVTEWFLTNPNLKTLVVDDATFAQKFAMNVAIQSNAELRTQGVSSMDKGRKYGFPIIEIDDYQKQMNMFEWYLANTVPACRELKKNFILLAHERHLFSPPTKQGEQSELKFVKPGFTGKTFPDAVTAYFDLIWRFSVQSGKIFQAQTMPTLIYDAKTRWSGEFKEIETNINFPNIEKRIIKKFG